MSKKIVPQKYVLLGATDRVNYGDNLMPYIVTAFLNKYSTKQYRIKNYGTISSKLVDFGALPTHPISKMYFDPFVEDATVVVVGGEVVMANWGKILSFCYNLVFIARRIRIVNRLFSEGLSKRLLGGRTEFPFIISPNNFRHKCSVVYNSVGGPRKNAPSHVVESLSSASYISVRDQDSAENLLVSAPNMTVEITPDSCILMSEFYPVDQLYQIAGESVKDYVQGTPYLYFQVGLSKSKGKVQELGDQLIAAFRDHNLQICLCPIGRAPGHHDQIALNSVKNYIKQRGFEKAVMFFPKPTLWEVMLLIAKAKIYVGTSLHGVITAQSFGVPYIAINQNLNKVAKYLESWATSDLAEVYPLEDWYQQLNRLLSKPDADISIRNEIVRLTEKQMAISRRSLVKMLLPSAQEVA